MTLDEQRQLRDIVSRCNALLAGLPLPEDVPAVLKPPTPPYTPPPPSVPITGRVIECSVEMTGQMAYVDNFTDQTVICKLVVPDWPVSNPNSISVFEHRGPPTFRRAWLSKTWGDMSSRVAPFHQVGQGPVFQFCINGNDPNAVQMKSGETWYLMIRNEGLFPPYPQSHGGTDCPIGIKWYPPY